jgi:hypothetical protein
MSFWVKRTSLWRVGVVTAGCSITARRQVGVGWAAERDVLHGQLEWMHIPRALCSLHEVSGAASFKLRC